MLRKLSSHATYANVVATIALFLALGGGAYAALGKNSVGRKQLKTNAVTGIDANEATFGTVPSAKNADTVDGANASDLKTSSAFQQDNSTIASLGNGNLVPVATATITTQSAGRILASGSAELVGADAGEVGQCQIVIDGTPSILYESAPDDIGTDNDIVIAVNFAVIRPAGSYSASLECRGETGAVGKDDAAINVYGHGA